MIALFPLNSSATRFKLDFAEASMIKWPKPVVKLDFDGDIERVLIVLRSWQWDDERSESGSKSCGRPLRLCPSTRAIRFTSG